MWVERRGVGKQCSVSVFRVSMPVNAGSGFGTEILVRKFPVTHSMGEIYPCPLTLNWFFRTIS